MDIESKRILEYPTGKKVQAHKIMSYKNYGSRHYKGLFWLKSEFTSGSLQRDNWNAPTKLFFPFFLPVY